MQISYTTIGDWRISGRGKHTADDISQQHMHVGMMRAAEDRSCMNDKIQQVAHVVDTDD